MRLRICYYGPRFPRACRFSACLSLSQEFATGIRDHTIALAGCREDLTLYTLARLEETGLSLWLRESGPAFFTSLTLHSLAMACVVGINIALCLRLLRFTPAFPLSALQGLYRLHWWAVLVIFLSGLALLLAYPAKALTNPVFYLKLTALGAGLGLAWYLQMRGSAAPQKSVLSAQWLASLALLCWVVTIAAGRFLAYTHNVLLASRYF